MESKGVRSPEFSLEVVDLPFVKQIDLTLNFPACTRMASKKIENGREVATLKGTVVELSGPIERQREGRANSPQRRDILRGRFPGLTCVTSDNHDLDCFRVGRRKE